MPELAPPPSPRVVRGRAARLVAASDIAVMFMGSTLVTPLYALYRDTFGFSDVTLTLVYATYVLGNAAALFFLGRISDQIGRRRTTFAAIAIAVASSLAFLFATGTPWLFVGRALSGLAIGLASGAATAWITELMPNQDKARASVVATGANFAGLAVGPLLAGLLAQYVPAPLRLPHVVYLALLILLGWLISRTEETVRQPVRGLRETSLRPRIGVPREIRARFVSPASTAFAMFALLGFYAALAPSLLTHDTHTANVAMGGALVAELFFIAAAAVRVTGPLRPHTAMLAGVALLIPSVALLVAAQVLASLSLLVVATAITGVASALGYRGSLHVVNEIAPGDRRAEVISSYMLACYLGNSLPVVGVGVVSSTFGPTTAIAALAVVIVALALVALLAELRGRERRKEHDATRLHDVRRMQRGL